MKKTVLVSFMVALLLPFFAAKIVFAEGNSKSVMTAVEYYKTLLWKQDNYFSTKKSSAFTAFHKKPDNCDDKPPADKLSCLKVACKYAGDCQYDHNLEVIGQWCKGIDGQCVEDFCQVAGDCQYDHNLKDIIQQCKGINGDCAKVACKYAGDCQYDHNLKAIAEWCQGVSDSDCIDTMCGYAGDCQYDHNLEKIVKSCRD